MSVRADTLEQPPAGLPPELASAAQKWDELLSGADENLDAAYELGVWLRALQSFFKLSNHPLHTADAASIAGHDFLREAVVARETLRRCSHLSFVLRSSEQSALYPADKNRASSLVSGDLVGETNGQGDVPAEDLSEIISEFCALGEALRDTRPVRFEVWTAFGKIITRQLEHTESASQAASAALLGHMRSPLWPELRTLAEGITPDALGADICAVFSKLLGMLDLLGLVEGALAQDRPLKHVLPLFTLLREDALSMLTMLDERTLRIEGLDPAVAEQLDGTAYAVRMEMRKTFEHELTGLAALTHAPHIYAKVENAHGLLRDCFRQSIIALAQIFEPQLEGARLFGAFKTKLEQSLALRQNLWDVLQAVRHAEGGHDHSVASLVERLQGFRGSSLRHLMYKDWDAYERFVEEVAAAKGAGEQKAVLHRFSAYLETLFSQVNMRAVLADRPFVPPAK